MTNKNIDLVKLAKHIDEMRKSLRFICINSIITSSERISIEQIISKLEDKLISLTQ
jgi:hypothetical protein